MNSDPSAGNLHILDATKLRFRYFAKLNDSGGLVPGCLHQGRPPKSGKWIELSKISRRYDERYFVKMASRRTLVPGLLIMSSRYPRGKWKEL